MTDRTGLYIMVFLGMIGRCNSASDSQVSKLEKKVDVLMKAQVVKEEVITCPDGKYLKSLYINDFNVAEFNERSNDYKALCCSETIEL